MYVVPKATQESVEREVALAWVSIAARVSEGRSTPAEATAYMVRVWKQMWTRIQGEVVQREGR